MEPGSRWLNGNLRDECLNEELFNSRGKARVLVDWWREVYNKERPHMSLGYRTPAEAAETNITVDQRTGKVTKTIKRRRTPRCASCNPMLRPPPWPSTHGSLTS
ncbi:MAG: transposase [Planctomycetes bacterium]|nr:transposase [Planctomycetota bacterium]